VRLKAVFTVSVLVANSVALHLAKALKVVRCLGLVVPLWVDC
tara:strand:- start:245 stop:370 length:126 start_codon:yes stop_codon:yes gene_type:complete